MRAFEGKKLVIDHHQPAAEPPGSVIVADTTACATGEIVFDLARVMDLEITPAIARALYTAMLTDTGGFRYSNTTPRCHAVAAQLLAAGVDPEEMYRRIYAQVSVGRLQLLREALESLEVDATYGLSWISLPAGVLEKYDVRAEDLDGLSEHPRSVAGTRMALFFRDLGHGQVKVSFRSTGWRGRAPLRQGVRRRRPLARLGGDDPREARRGAAPRARRRARLCPRRRR